MSWIVTRIRDGAVIGEFFNRRTVERINREKYRVESAGKYLGPDQSRDSREQEIERAMTMEMNIKCTSCGKSRLATPEQIAEAREMGCFFSACCQAVVTVNAVTIKRAPPKKRASR